MAKNPATTAAKLRENSPEELTLRLEECRKELWQFRVGRVTKTLENPHVISAKRREIARILTILGEKQRTAAKS